MEQNAGTAAGPVAAAAVLVGVPVVCSHKMAARCVFVLLTLMIMFSVPAVHK